MSAAPHLPKPPVAGIALTEHDALPAGTRFGEFEIIRVLGVGGFGIVYLAQDHSLERQVALKEYMPAALASRGAGPMVTIRAGSFAETYAMGLRSFINESRLLARFDHPSLVKVYRFWEDNGTAYMVMPYLQGRTLRDARRAMGQTPNEAWIRGVLDPLLDALELLHREGVFHRDIAPDNILLLPDASPILLDFGAARRVISDRTQSFTAILKPSYAPIEQYAEMAAMRQGPWTDLYALGAVLHYLLFGVPPAPATARAVEPDAEQIEQRIVAGVSPRLMHVVAWMLGVRPLDRPQSVASLRAALDGEVPIPLSVRHDAAWRSAPAPRLMAVVEASTLFAPTRAEPRLRSAVRADDPALSTVPPAGAPSEAVSLPAAERPPAMTTIPAVAALLDAAQGRAPMRSTPPGKPPPAYVPPPHRPHVAPSAPAAAAVGTPMPVVLRPARRGWIVAGAAAGLALTASALWKFTVADDPRPPLAGPIAAAGAPADPSLATDARMPTGPIADEVASAARSDAEAAVSGGTASVPPPTVRPVTADTAAFAPAAALGSRTNQAAPAAVVTPSREERRARPPASRPAPPYRPDSRIAAGPRTVREACGDRRFIALAVCIDRECERPRFRATPECVQVLEVKRRRAEP